MCDPTDSNTLKDDVEKGNGSKLYDYGSVNMYISEGEDETERYSTSEDTDSPLLVVQSMAGPPEHKAASSVEANTIEKLLCDDVDEDPNEDPGTATILDEVATMVKNLVGSGVLSLPGGIALYANNPSGMGQACLLIAVMGTIFGYFLLVIAKVCEMKRAYTYQEAWRRTIGERGAIFIPLTLALNAGRGNLSFSVILSYTFQSLLQSVGIHMSRPLCLILLTVFFILPLCLLKNLRVLAPFSAFGTASVTVTVAAMIWRALDGSYRPGGKYWNDPDLLARPSFGTVNDASSMAVLPFCCMLFESYVMHYNGPRFYRELKHRSMSRFLRVVLYAFIVAVIFYVAIAGAGFLTFGEGTASYILNSYSPHDPLASLSRLCVGLSILMTYPILFIGCRDGILDVMQVPLAKQTGSNINIATVVLLAVFTLLAAFFSDLGRIAAFGGGTMATLVVFVFPAFMYRSAVKDDGSASEKRLVIPTLALMVAGVVLGLVGVWTAITNE